MLNAQSSMLNEWSMKQCNNALNLEPCPLTIAIRRIA